MKKVLVVEDDRDIVDLLMIHLEDLDCSVDVSYRGDEGLEKALKGRFDLMILDVMLPGKDGIQIAQKLRALDVHTPILMLTARAEEIDKVLGLESGADDYLTKPFSVREFIARVKAIFRRQQIQNQYTTEKNQKLISVGNLTIDAEKRKVTINENRVDLTPKEFDLLLLLASHPGRSYSREELLNEVWGYEFSGYEHTVNAHVNRLRLKIEPNQNEPSFLLTTWGVGYRFSDEL